MRQFFDFEFFASAFPRILQALPITLIITIVSMSLGLIFGLIIALFRVRKVPVFKELSRLFVSFFRGTPLVVQIYLSYTGIPLLLLIINHYFGTDFNVSTVPSMVFVLVAFTLNQTAYNSETIRAALQSVDYDQIEAGLSIGMTNYEILKRIILPEAVVIAFPNFGNSVISLMLGTSLAFTAAVVDMTARAKLIAAGNMNYFEAYLALAVIYWIITLILESIMSRIEERLRIPEDVPLRSERL